MLLKDLKRNLSNLAIAACKQNASEEFPQIDTTKELEITLKIKRVNWTTITILWAAVPC